MGMNVDNWRTSTKSIFTGVLLYSLGGIVAAILVGITAIVATAGFASGSGGAIGAAAGLGIFAVIAGIVVIVGYILYFIGIGKFRDAVDEADKPTVQKIYTAIIILIAGTVIALIPILGIVGKIANIVAYILMLLAYMNLRDSSTFPELARAGAKILFLSMIISLCGVILGWIPVLSIVGGICQIAAFVMVFIGWSRIKNAVQ